MRTPTSMAPLKVCSSGWMNTHRIFPANYGFHSSSSYATFLRMPTTRECQKLRDFSPCGVSHTKLDCATIHRNQRWDKSTALYAAQRILALLECRETAHTIFLNRSTKYVGSSNTTSKTGHERGESGVGSCN